MDKSRRLASAAASVLVMLIVGGCGGGTSPASVEKKAHTLAQQALDAIRPDLGPATTSVEHQGWKSCGTETPGDHEFEYMYILKLDVLVQNPTAVLAAAKAHFVQQGYLPNPPQTGRVSARGAHSTWGVAVGVDDGNKSMFISIDSHCVSTSHDPPQTN